MKPVVFWTYTRSENATRMSHIPLDLSRRERQIMLVLYERGEGSVQDVLDRLDDPPSYSAVRTLLRILEEKGHLSSWKDGQRLVYRPVVARDEASHGVLHQVVRAFFNGSAEQTVATLLEMNAGRLDPVALDRLQTLIERAKQQEPPSSHGH